MRRIPHLLVAALGGCGPEPAVMVAGSGTGGATGPQSSSDALTSVSAETLGQTSDATADLSDDSGSS